MKTSLSGSFLLVAFLGVGVTSLARTASAETDKPGKTPPAKDESAKSKAAPAKDESAKSKAAPAKDEGTKSKAAPAKDEGTKSKAAPAKDESAKSKAAPAEDSPKKKMEASLEGTLELSVDGSVPAQASHQPTHSGQDGVDRKVSPFASSVIDTELPDSVQEENPSSGYAYPPSGFPPPGYGYPPPGYGYPPPGYGYPPPGYGYPPPGYGPACCRFCSHAARGRWPQLPPEERPGYHAHDGFYLRLGLGGGYAQTSVSINGGTLTYSGTSIPLDLAIGAAIRPNLILFGELMSNQIYSPTSEYAGQPQASRSRMVNIQGVGPGLAYYFMPINIYVSGSVLIHKVSFTDDNDDYNATDLSTLGFAANLMTGKDWWVSPDWGVGLSAYAMLGTAKDRTFASTPDDSFWNSIAFGLLMSATYN